MDCTILLHVENSIKKYNSTNRILFMMTTVGLDENNLENQTL